MNDDQKPTAWLYKYARPQSEKPSGAQRRKNAHIGRPVEVKQKPPRQRVSPPAPQVLTGAYGTADYAAIKAAQRSRAKIQFRGLLYRVLSVQIMSGPEGKIFRATVRRVAEKR